MFSMARPMAQEYNLSPTSTPPRLDVNNLQAGALTAGISAQESEVYDEDFSDFVNFEPEDSAVPNSQEVGHDRIPEVPSLEKPRLEPGSPLVTGRASSKLSIVTGSQLLSPELSNDPSPVSAHGGDKSQPYLSTSFETNTQSCATHLPSPAARVEDWNKNKPPHMDTFSRSMSRENLNGDASPLHASPAIPHAWSNNQTRDGADHLNEQTAIQMASIQRSAEGSWLPGAVKRPLGVGPESRAHIGEVTVPTLAEQDESKRLGAKQAEVEQWLSCNHAKSKAGANSARENLVANPDSPPARRRANSLGDASVGEGPLAKPVICKNEEVYGSRMPRADVAADEDNGHEEDPDPFHDEEALMSAAMQRYRIDEEPKMQIPPLQDIDDMERPWNARVWSDPPPQAETPEWRYQPDSSSAAMMRFYQRSRDIETASRTATIASSLRRLSEPDLNSLYERPTKPKRFSLSKDKDKAKMKRDRSGSVLDNILKRKTSHPAQPSHETELVRNLSQDSYMSSGGVRGNNDSSFPRLNTAVTAAHTERGSAGGFTYAHTSPFAQISNVLRRSRSRSDMQKPQGLVALMTQHGGPPVATLATRRTTAERGMDSGQHRQSDTNDAAEEDEEDEAVAEQHDNLAIRPLIKPIAPTLDAFRDHIRQLSPRLPPDLVDKFAKEQIARLNRLAALMEQHLAAVSSGNCTKLCPLLGASPKILPVPSSKKTSDSCLVGFTINEIGTPEDEVDLTEGATLLAAQLPAGIPFPPVKQLPAEFECPLCFEVKTILKPSDWTKHVHEDVQPFTCSFSSCKEPKSFKRKADWVRHENESHRHLESWVCNMPDCAHRCYRKDNFLKHLEREHKVYPSKEQVSKINSRTSNGAADVGTDTQSSSFSSPATQGEVIDVAKLLRVCHQGTTHRPQQEPCRFCGKALSTWKKLTVHLAKHMEEISLPVLAFINDDTVAVGGPVNPVMERQEQVEPRQEQQTATAIETSPLQATNLEVQSSNPPHTREWPVDARYNGGQSMSNTFSTIRNMHSYPPPDTLLFNGPAPTHDHRVQLSSSPSNTGMEGESLTTNNGQRPATRDGSQQVFGLQSYPPAPRGPVYPSAQFGQAYSHEPNSRSYPPAQSYHTMHRSSNNQVWTQPMHAPRPSHSPLMVAPVTNLAQPQVFLSPTDTIPRHYGQNAEYFAPDVTFPYSHQQGLGQYQQMQISYGLTQSRNYQNYSYPPQ